MGKAWGLILAAGASRRFGGVKVLAPWRSGTLLSQAIATSRAAFSERVMVVTGAHHDFVTPHLDGVPHAHNPRWESGMGGSIACGVMAILDREPDASAITILPADQPFVTADHLQALALKSQNENAACFTSGPDAVFGPPAAVPARLFPLAAALQGAHGLKALLSGQPMLSIHNLAALRDIDTPGELELAAHGRWQPI